MGETIFIYLMLTLTKAHIFVTHEPTIRMSFNIERDDGQPVAEDDIEGIVQDYDYFVIKDSEEQQEAILETTPCQRRRTF